MKTFFRPKLLDPKAIAPKRICIIKPSALGDVVQALELLPVIRATFPGSSISWVINKSLMDLVSGHPCLDEAIPFDRNGGWFGFLNLMRTLRSRKFDLVLDLQGLLRSSVLVRATNAKNRVGLELAREGASWATNWRIGGTDLSVPPKLRYQRVARQLGWTGELGSFQIVTSPTDQTWADEIVRNLPRPIFAVHPGARWETKRWPVEKYAALLQHSTREWHGSTVILGSGIERPDAERLQQLLGDGSHSATGAAGCSAPAPILNLAGRTTLKQLAALVARVDAVISNDSGPMHSAAGLGTPTLGVFTCTSATRSGPAGNQHELVSTTVSCAASYCKKCPNRGAAHLACLAELDVDRVWNALQRLVAKNSIGRETRAA